MFTELRELYNLYKIYKKFQDIASCPEHIKANPECCSEIKTLILADGCIAIKFTQWIISRMRSEPGEHIKFIVEYFDDIFDKCPYHDIEYTREIFRKSYFFELDDIIVPGSLMEIASGSVGQIYKATLVYPYIVCDACDIIILYPDIASSVNNKNYTVGAKGILDPNTTTKVLSRLDGTYKYNCGGCGNKSNGRAIYQIAIKVKHPDINQQVDNKIKLFKLLSSLQKFKWIKDLLGIHMDMNDFIQGLKKQIDFKNEYHNNRQFRVNFRNNNMVQFPLALEAHDDYLISEYVETTAFEADSEYSQLKVCLNYACMISQMVLIDNFIHADLHHKNWQISKAVPGQLVVFDVGICFSADDIRTSKTIWESFETGNITDIMDIMDKMISGPYTENVRSHINLIFENYKTSVFNVSYIMSKVNEILIVHNCCLTNLSLNIILLLCLIDTTMKKHNLFGDDVQPLADTIETIKMTDYDIQESSELTVIPEDLPRLADISPTRIHNNFIRNKTLDLLAFIKSNPGCYPELNKYFTNKLDRYKDDVTELFGNSLSTGLIMDCPE